MPEPWVVKSFASIALAAGLRDTYVGPGIELGPWRRKVKCSDPKKKAKRKAARLARKRNRR